MYRILPQPKRINFIPANKIDTLLKAFYFKDKKRIFKKINLLAGDGVNKLHLVLDFDRTLTESRNKLGKDISTWAIFEKHLPSKAQNKYKKLWGKYYQLEINGQLKLQDAWNWWEKCLQLYIENPIRWIDVSKDLHKELPIRAGVKELFALCQLKKVPIIIISAGLKNIIELWCKKMNLRPSIILSTELIFSKKGYLTSFRKETLIHVLNKKEKGHKELSKIREARQNTILIGDTLHDSQIVDGDQNVLRIITGDRLNIDKNRLMRSKYLEKFDLIIKGKSLRPIVNLLELFQQ